MQPGQLLAQVSHGNKPLLATWVTYSTAVLQLSAGTPMRCEVTSTAKQRTTLRHSIQVYKGAAPCTVG